MAAPSSSSSMPNNTAAPNVQPAQAPRRVLRWGCRLCPGVHYERRRFPPGRSADSLEAHVREQHPTTTLAAQQYQWGHRVYQPGVATRDDPLPGSAPSIMRQGRRAGVANSNTQPTPPLIHPVAPPAVPAPPMTTTQVMPIPAPRSLRVTLQFQTPNILSHFNQPMPPQFPFTFQSPSIVQFLPMASTPLPFPAYFDPNLFIYPPPPPPPTHHNYPSLTWWYDNIIDDMEEQENEEDTIQ